MYRDLHCTGGGQQADLPGAQRGAGAEIIFPLAQLLAAAADMLAGLGGATEANHRLPPGQIFQGNDRVAPRRQRSAGHDAHRRPGLETSFEEFAGRYEAGDRQFVPFLLPGEGEGIPVHGRIVRRRQVPQGPHRRRQHQAAGLGEGDGGGRQGVDRLQDEA